MSDKPKTIQEALAEVQRKINEQQKNNMINEYEAFSSAGQWLADRKRPGDTWYKDRAKEAKDTVSNFLNKPANASTADYAAAKSDSSSGEKSSSVFSRMKQSSEPSTNSSTPKSDTTPATSTPKTDSTTSSGDKPVSVVKTKGGDYNVYAKGSDKAADFRKTYAAAKGNFEWEGRKYAKPSSEPSKPAATTSTTKPVEKTSSRSEEHTSELQSH